MTNAPSLRTPWIRIVRSALLRGVVFGALWVILSGWDAEYAVYGVVSVLAAAGLSLALLPPRAREGGSQSVWHRLAAMVTLPLWFMWKSVIGGVDVAARALRRPADVAPTVITVPCDLPEGNARQIALLMMNLMPGTMVQQIVDDHDDETAVQLHTLSLDLDPAGQWRSLQERVTRAIGIP